MSEKTASLQAPQAREPVSSVEPGSARSFLPSDRPEDRLPAKTLSKLALLCTASAFLSDLIMAGPMPEAAAFTAALKQAGFFPLLFLLLEFLLPIGACILLVLALRTENQRDSALFPVSVLVYAAFLLIVFLERIAVNRVGDPWYAIAAQCVLIVSASVSAVLCLCRRRNNVLTVIVSAVHILFWIGCGAACMASVSKGGAKEAGLALFSREGVILSALRAGYENGNIWTGLAAFLYLFQLFWPLLFLGAVIVVSLPRPARTRSLRTLVILSMLTAMEIVLNRFLSINAWNLKIGFSFIPVVVAAMLYGPAGGACVAALGDFLGAILFPIGPYFPGFTFTALLTGIVFGLFLRRKQTPLRTVIAVLINQLGLSLLLNTFWISVLYKSPYFPTLLSRIPQCAVLIPVQIALILAFSHALRRLKFQKP